jgi:hypothetical protein
VEERDLSALVAASQLRPLVGRRGARGTAEGGDSRVGGVV